MESTISVAGLRAGTGITSVAAFRTSRGSIAVSTPFFLTKVKNFIIKLPFVYPVEMVVAVKRLYVLSRTVCLALTTCLKKEPVHIKV